jgi:predicted Zn-dependent peptidase
MLSGTRTARLNANLVQRGLAYSANAVTAYPADKHACAMLLYALPSANVTLPAAQRLLREQLASLGEAGPTPAELQRVKKVRLQMDALT